MRHLIRFVIVWLVRLFYPRIVVAGREHVPTSGPIIFVLNHPNGLLDPLLLMLALDRRVAFLAKSTFWGNPIGRLCMQTFGALPVFRQHDAGQPGSATGDATARNETTFARCRALLREDGALALFPEGTTHSEAHLLPLKTGAARIALGAEAENKWRLGVRIVPVGLHYEAKSIFRSGVRLQIGAPFTLTELAPTYAADPLAAVRAATRRIANELGAVVSMPADPIASHPVTRRASSVRSGVLLVLTLPLAFAGWLLSYGPYRLAGLITPRCVGYYDTLIGTGKLIVGSILVALGWIFAAVVVVVAVDPLAGMLLLLVAPGLGYIALRWGERWHALRTAV